MTKEVGAACCCDYTGSYANSYSSNKYYYRRCNDFTSMPLDIPMGATRLYINGNPFNTFPANGLVDRPTITYIDMQYNSIAHLENGALAGLDDLSTVYLNYNDLTEIRPGQFDGLTELSYLSLTHNQIHTLVPGCFEGLVTLDNLYINNNILTSLQSGIFTDLIDLHELRLHYNKIGTIEMGTFENLADVYTINLNYNEISFLEPGLFSDMSNLYNVYLRHNQLTVIKTNTFLGCKNVHYLHLESNKIYSIETLALNGMKNIRFIHLQYNDLVTLSYSILNPLDFPGSSSSTFDWGRRGSGNKLYIDLDDNLLNCNSSLCWMKYAEDSSSWLEGNYHHGAYCHKPSYTKWSSRRSSIDCDGKFPCYIFIHTWLWYHGSGYIKPNLDGRYNHGRYK